MTISAAPRASLRTELHLATRQLVAIDRFNAARASREATLASVSRTREVRLDAARRLDVVRRQQAALVARSHEQLQRSGGAVLTAPATRAVLAHRDDWFVDKVRAVLREHLIEVVACPSNGADAVGLAVAEQPDLVLVEDTLEMVSGEEVVRELRRFCPDTLIAAHVPFGDRVGAMLEAGATTVFTRQVPPVDIAVQLLDLLADA